MLLDPIARHCLGHQHVGDAFDVVEHQHRQLRLRQRAVACDRHDAIVLRTNERLADGCAIDFKLRMREPLETLDNDEIDRSELRQEVGERKFRLVAKLVNQRPAAAGGGTTSLAPASRCSQEVRPDGRYRTRDARA